MGLCLGKHMEPPRTLSKDEMIPVGNREPARNSSTGKTPKFPFYSPSPLFKNSPLSTPLRFLKRPFPPPSPAKHIKALLRRRHDSIKNNEMAIPEGRESEIIELDKNFGFCNNFPSHCELGDEIGRGHFGYTCSARGKKGSLKGLDLAVKVIPKAQMTSAIAIEDVRREVKIMRALTGHNNLVHFYEAYEDQGNVYVVMELCKGGELLDRILSRGGKYSEDDAKTIMVQILNAVAYCHLQGVVHRDLKPENFLFTSKDEDSPLKAIDFGLSDYVKPDERLNDIVGSAYYVAPETVLGKNGIWDFPICPKSRSDLRRSSMAIFVSRCCRFCDLNKDYRKRITASQALCNPWLAGTNKIPLDMIIYRLVKSYICASSSLRKTALKALAKTLTVPQLNYLRQQFALLGPNRSSRYVSMQNFQSAIARNKTDAMKDSRVIDYANSVSSLQYRKLDFEEFCAAAISVHQLEATDSWEQHARRAYEFFDQDGNRPIMIEELASELVLSPSVPVHVVLKDWIRHSDGMLSFLGFV